MQLIQNAIIFGPYDKLFCSVSNTIQKPYDEN